MRKSSLMDAILAFSKFKIPYKDAIAIDVGGTDIVNLDGNFVVNPILKMCRKVMMFDGGFSVNKICTSSHVTGDFTAQSVTEIYDSIFDISFTFDTLEHVRNPFRFCENLIAITKPGGIIFAATVFSWAYHPAPEDYYRFSPTGLQELFISELNGKAMEFQILESGWSQDNNGVYLLGRRNLK